MWAKGRIFLVMKDDKSGDPPLIVNTKTEAIRANKEGCGVFYTVNAFKGKSRKTEDLDSILAWAIDIDDMSKERQRDIILESPLIPSYIIETKRGYHVIWCAENASISNHKKIMERLVEFYSADTRAKDLCRFLRMPGFYHLKDKNNPFLVKYVMKEPWRVYTDEKMLFAFAKKKKKDRKNYKKKDVAEYDNMKALEILSGRSEVGGEEFSFKKNSSGYQILVNRESTSCWIDKEGKIGSHDKGGTTWINFLMWYGYNYDEALKIGEMYGIKRV